MLTRLIEAAQPYFSTLSFGKNPLAIIDIVIVSLLFYGIYILIKDTKAMRIAIGIILISAIFVVGKILHLAALAWLLKYFVTFIVVAIPVVFQPELRRALERLGRAKVIRRTKELSARELEKLLDILVDSVSTLVKSKTGALIVIKRSTGLADHIEKGTELNSELSKDLLLNLFFPNSPLHDGAVVISGNQVMAAGVVLPLTEKDMAYKVGTRHKAAIGITEQTDAIAIVVSEEQGTVSLSIDGDLKKQSSPEKLRETLRKLLN